MNEMVKATKSKCVSCKWSYGYQGVEIICGYLLDTGRRRNVDENGNQECPPGYCNKYEKKRRKSKHTSWQRSPLQ